MVERARAVATAPRGADAPESSTTVPWGAIAAAVLALRLLLTGIGAAIAGMLPHGRGAQGLQGMLLDPWRQFDAVWFTHIAQFGYGAADRSTAYMPLYPALIRLAAVLTGGHYLIAALLVSNLACVVGCGLLWRWVAERWDAGTAWRTVGLLLVFPDSFYLLGAYSESLFLALSAASLLAMRGERWQLAGTLAALAALTRLQGLVLMVPLALALRRVAPRMPRRRASGLVALALPAAAFLAYQRLLTWRLGGGDILDAYQRQWNIPLQAPWQTLWRYVEVIRSPRWHLFHSPEANYIMLWDLLIGLAVLAVLLGSWRALGWEMAIYGLTAWAFALTRWFSTGRYMLAVLPFFAALALWAGSRRRYRWLSTAFLVLLVFYTAEFSQGSWVD